MGRSGACHTPSSRFKFGWGRGLCPRSPLRSPQAATEVASVMLVVAYRPQLMHLPVVEYQ